MRYENRIAVVAVAAIYLTSAAAHAATIDIGQALTGSMQDIINAVVTALIAGLVGWVAVVFKNKLGVDIEAQYRDALSLFLQRQASSLIAMGAVKLNGVKVQVQSQPLADAANLALQHIPDTLKFFNLTPERLQQMIVDVLPKQPSIAQAQAVALDVQNPATPTPAVVAVPTSPGASS